jgi:hypothetical protein
VIQKDKKTILEANEIESDDDFIVFRGEGRRNNLLIEV